MNFENLNYLKFSFFIIKLICLFGENGRHERLKIYFLGVQVQVL